MKEYYVTIPCTMSVIATVEAEGEAAAKRAALEIDFSLELKSDDPASPEIGEFETHEQIVRGNVYSGCINEMEVEEA